MTKREMVAELKSNGVEESETSLKKKSNKELEKMLGEVTAKADEPQAESPSLDMNDLKAQMMAELKGDMMAELKAQAKAEVEAEMKANEEPEEAPQKHTASTRIKASQVDRTELVQVMNVTNGSLTYISPKTGLRVEFEQYGDTEYIEVGELLTMRSSSRRFLHEPWLLVMDDEVVDYLGLDKLYDKMVKPDEIDEVFESFSLAKFKETLDTAPKGIATLIATRGKQLVEEGKLDSFHKMKALNERFNLELGK